MLICGFVFFLVVSLIVGIFILHVDIALYKQYFYVLFSMFIMAVPCFFLLTRVQRFVPSNHKLILKSNGLYFFLEESLYGKPFYFPCRKPFFLPWKNIYRISRYKRTKILIEFTATGIDIPRGITVHQNSFGPYPAWILSCAFLNVSTEELFNLMLYYYNRRKSKIAKDC